ncbi:MAG TPA: 5-formyltetrahydrofolate cyclo-ligase [Stellaceae bacterium]|nr:5-formyltetrahydrofolate cyclo-ligase [Stellaceae bacterium]
MAFSTEPPADLATLKVVARRQAQRQRAEAHAAGAASAAEAVALHAARWLADRPGIVSGYWPMRTELDCRPLLHGLAAAGRGLALPVVLSPAMPLGFRRWQPGVALVPGGFGTLVPPPEAETVEPDVLLVPLLAFDRQGRRLGYGGGFYDRTLAALRRHRPVVALGVAYAMQEMPDLPSDALDQPLDAVVTEQGICA